MDSSHLCMGFMSTKYIMLKKDLKVDLIIPKTGFPNGSLGVKRYEILCYDLKFTLRTGLFIKDGKI